MAANTVATIKNQNMVRFITYIVALWGLAFTAQAQISSFYDSGGTRLAPFRNGFAKITDHDQVYYIDLHGAKFELAETTSVGFNDEYAIQQYDRQVQEDADVLPNTVLKYRKGGKMGILSPRGEILLPAEYDGIDIEYRQFWTVKRAGKVSLWLADKTLLPFFDDIGYLDGEYFDVKQNGTWQLYSKTQKRVITRAGYDAFDYCGGCGNGSSYLYAQKNGKWGIIDWNEKILVPFEYEHTHRSMRSDNWVTSFSKAGAPVVVHIPTQKEFVDAEVRMGVVIAKKNNLYGVYGQDGELKIPFEFEGIEAPNDNSYLGYNGEYLVTTKQHKKGVMNLLGTQILPAVYDDIKVYGDYLVAQKQQISYLLDRRQKTLLEVENATITHANEYFYSSGGKGMDVFKIKKRAFYGLYFAKTNTYIAPAYYAIQLADFKHESRADKYVIAEKNKLFTVYNLEGQVLLSDVEGVSELYHGPDHLVTYVKDGKSGLYDLEAKKEVIPAMYDSFENWTVGSSTFIKANVRIPESEQIDAYITHKSHLYDLHGKKILGADIERIDTIHTKLSLIKVRNGDRHQYLLLDMDNQRTERLDYKAVYPVNSPKVLLVSNDDKTGRLYDIASKKIRNGVYRLDYITQGYIPENLNRELIILPFKGNMALVRNEKGYGYINEEGKVVVTPQYVWAFDFINHAALVCQSENGETNAINFKMGFISKSGQSIFPLAYDLMNSRLNHVEALFMGDMVILPKLDNYTYQYGLGDLRTGKEVLPVAYTQIQSIRNANYLLLQQQDKFGIADREGRIVLPVAFDEILFDAPTFFGSDEETVTDIFPLLVYREGAWKYIRKDGTYLSIEK